MSQTQSPQPIFDLPTLTRELELDDRVKVAGVDIDGILRGKVILKSKFFSSLKSGFGFCSVIFGWDMHDKAYTTPTTISNDANGFSDIIAKIDLSTYRRLPLEDNLPFFLLRFYDRNHHPLAACPRSLLARIVGEYEALGLEPLCGAEFEFFNYKETPASLETKQGVGLSPITPGMFGYSLLRPALEKDFFTDIFTQCREIRVPIEGLHTETGPGVYEAALKYAPALEMADRAVLFKTIVKQVGLKHGIIASFMAKPDQTLPGCSGHLHFSIRDSQKNNLFFDPSAGPSEATDPYRMRGMSSTMASFLTGLLVGLPSVLALLAPTVNSYKRLVENYWAPVYINWGKECRTASIRAIGADLPPADQWAAMADQDDERARLLEEGASTRLEMRVSGSDINTHLAIAACLACGLWGIKNQLDRLPGKVEVTGEENLAYPRGLKLSRTLQEAVRVMQEPQSIARQVLGDEFVDHYALTREHEWQAWENAVTNWEVKRYLEIL
ncbi:hypothetical protein BJ085DRAFT_20064 [Dimargaris cristalligena]|uniref:Glutamine synthetase n=1 Tax=Dimargaris cristalligena TaxID=215637 RepID=A0A4P9ZL50_9FUNG|nr:hypothetical protein BJ085DRAFT_20064 [Dimargaris cristalligena]|eukprot:RKP34026.1 hypothetical protein BJ085DRAFT_20064 [Dimargaris cristalligena]